MMKPNSKPRLSEEAVREIVRQHKVKSAVAIVGVRGYYRDSMGAVGRNDRGIYDDAVFVVSDHAFASFNANTDPSVRRPGIATLKPGVHLYRKGKHGISRPGGGYPALRPATEGEALPVTRDGLSGEKKGIAINIHRGSRTSTSSEGCQTIHPDQWDAFLKLVYGEMARAGQTTVPYVLTEQK
jgi:hypothetical protein